jgi:hypothetical protein
MKALQLGELYVRTSEASAKEVLFCGRSGRNRGARAKLARRRRGCCCPYLVGSLEE